MSLGHNTDTFLYLCRSWTVRNIWKTSHEFPFFFLYMHIHVYSMFVATQILSPLKDTDSNTGVIKKAGRQLVLWGDFAVIPRFPTFVSPLNSPDVRQVSVCVCVWWWWWWWWWWGGDSDPWLHTMDLHDHHRWGIWLRLMIRAGRVEGVAWLETSKWGMNTGVACS